MRVPLLNFEGGPGVLLLKFEGGPGVRMPFGGLLLKLFLVVCDQGKLKQKEHSTIFFIKKNHVTIVVCVHNIIFYMTFNEYG